MSSVKGSNKKARRGKSMRHRKEVEEDKYSQDGPASPYDYNPPGTGNSQNSITVSTNSNNLSFYSQDGGMNGERVKVAVRIRPLQKHEKGHNPILEVEGMK